MLAIGPCATDAAPGKPRVRSVAPDHGGTRIDQKSADLRAELPEEPPADVGPEPGGEPTSVADHSPADSAGASAPAGASPWWRRHSRRHSRGGGWTLLAALTLLVAAYVVSNPPGQASDEPSHFYKAAALSIGEVSGDPVDILGFAAWTPSMLAWVSETARILPVPPEYAGCDPFALPALGGRCQPSAVVLDRPVPPASGVSYVATYPVVAYLPPALGIGLASALDEGVVAAVLAARTAGAVAALILLGGAFRLLRRGGPGDLPAVAAASLAVTPIVVFTASHIGGSGLEMAAGLCFGAGLLRLADPAVADLSARATWAWTAVSGVLLVTGRTLGPLWIALIGLVVLALRGVRPLWAAARSAPITAAVASLAVALGGAASLAWQFLLEPRPETSLAIALQNVPAAVRQLPGVADMYVGRLAWIYIRLPLAVVLIWLLLLAALVVVAAVVGSRRERFAVALSVVVAIGTTIFISAYAIQPTSPGFFMQARYVMPVLTMVALVGADVLQRRMPAMAGRWGVRPVAVSSVVLGSVALMHVVAFEANVRESRAVWMPPLGWEAWEAVVTVAALLVIVGAARSLGTNAAATTDP